MFPSTASNSKSRGTRFPLIIFICLLGVTSVIFLSTFVLAKWNDSERQRLTKNNLQLVRDNRELRTENEKLRKQLTQSSDRLQEIDGAFQKLGYRRIQ